MTPPASLPGVPSAPQRPPLPVSTTEGRKGATLDCVEVGCYSDSMSTSEFRTVPCGNSSTCYSVQEIHSNPRLLILIRPVLTRRLVPQCLRIFQLAPTNSGISRQCLSRWCCAWSGVEGAGLGQASLESAATGSPRMLKSCSESGLPAAPLGDCEARLGLVPCSLSLTCRCSTGGRAQAIHPQPR